MSSCLLNPLQSCCHAILHTVSPALHARPEALCRTLPAPDRFLAEALYPAQLAGWSAELDQWRAHRLAEHAQQLEQLQRPEYEPAGMDLAWAPNRIRSAASGDEDPKSVSHMLVAVWKSALGAFDDPGIYPTPCIEHPHDIMAPI